MFYEVIRLDERGPNGERAAIGVARSDDAVSWQHLGIVLEEPFHLSYPAVFQDGGTWYMVPESGEAQRVILYESTTFPMEWRASTTLLEGVYRDPTIFVHDGTWWMFATDSGEVPEDTLRLFMAPDLKGPWTEHPASPVVDGDVSRSRSAGSVVVVDGALVRFAQDNSDGYGKAVYAYAISTLTPSAYDEVRVVGGPVVSATGSGWTASGMHHVSAVELDDGRWRVAVDGYETERVFGFDR
jgi:hypothetical protein